MGDLSEKLQRLETSETNNESLGAISFVSQTIVDIEESVRFTPGTRKETSWRAGGVKDEKSGPESESKRRRKGKGKEKGTEIYRPDGTVQ